MKKPVLEIVDELVDRINHQGCRVTAPYAEPSPLTVMFNGDFDGAEFIPSYPSTLHIFGINGHVAVSSINDIEQIRGDKYVVNFGNDSHHLDIMVKILE